MSDARVVIASGPWPAGARAEAGASLHLLQWFRNLSTPGFFMHRETLEVCDANTQGGALLGRSRSLSIVNGRLALTQKGAIERLRAALRDLDDAPQAHAIELDGDHAVMRLEPMAGSEMVSVLVITQSPETHIWADTGSVFGLTPAEDRLVRQLVDGYNIDEVAERLKISVETARTHVRRAYLKIGVSSREQLFAALSPFRLPA